MTTRGTLSSQDLKTRKQVKLHIPDFFYTKKEMVKTHLADFIKYRLSELYGKGTHLDWELIALGRMILQDPAAGGYNNFTQSHYDDFKLHIRNHGVRFRQIIGDYRFEYGVAALGQHLLKYSCSSTVLDVPVFSFEEIVETDHWDLYITDKQIRSELCLL